MRMIATAAISEELIKWLLDKLLGFKLRRSIWEAESGSESLRLKSIKYRLQNDF